LRLGSCPLLGFGSCAVGGLLFQPLPFSLLGTSPQLSSQDLVR
jgi:hypothetical protein